MYRNVLIVCVSVHHGNTLRIAEAMAKVLGARIIEPGELTDSALEECDLVGFGSGIYNGSHHEGLISSLDRISARIGKPAFIFSTATIPVKAMNRKLLEKASEKGFDIIGDFACRGFMDYGFTKIFGGINKGRPNQSDLENAGEFARRLTDGGIKVE